MPKSNGDELPPNDLAVQVLQDHSFISDLSGNMYEYQQPVWVPIERDVINSYAMAEDVHAVTTDRRRLKWPVYLEPEEAAARHQVAIGPRGRGGGQ